MESLTHEDKTFEKINYTGKTIKGREFQSCVFKKCDFSDSDFSFNRFMDCQFDSCNLSMIKLRGTTLSGVVFVNCKIMGVIFSDCDNFNFTPQFDSCILDYASFMGKKMLKTSWFKSSLKEVNFAQANLAGSVLDQSDLTDAVFNQTDLTGADLSTALNYTIDPELNTIKKATFSTLGLSGLLTRYQIKIV